MFSLLCDAQGLSLEKGECGSLDVHSRDLTLYMFGSHCNVVSGTWLYHFTLASPQAYLESLLKAFSDGRSILLQLSSLPCCSYFAYRVGASMTLLDAPRQELLGSWHIHALKVNQLIFNLLVQGSHGRISWSLLCCWKMFCYHGRSILTAPCASSARCVN